MKKDTLENAIKALKKGELVVYPTDTLYALGADVFNDYGVKKVFGIKKRPFSIPLPVAVGNYSSIEKIAYTNDIVKKVVDRFLPGSLTIVLRKKECISGLVTSNLDKVAIRIPNNKMALDLISAYKRPITVTSANIHNEETPYSINDIMMKFNTSISVYLDDGNLNGKPSTIIDLSDKKPRIVRKGSITLKDILDEI